MKVFTPPRAPLVHNPGVRFFHWLMAALILVALPLGVWASQLPRAKHALTFCSSTNRSE
jgi:cytochrome b561